MTKTGKFIVSIVTIALGILLIALQGTTVQVITSVLGVLLIVLGILDLLSKENLVGAVKLVFGTLILAFGWLISSIVLYVVAVALFIVAVWWIYELWRTRCIRSFSWTFVVQYLQPALLILIGILLLFHQGEGREWVFVLAGILTVAEGALLFATAVKTIS